ncbi:hypothetical protein HHI36_023813 [Cryptolaemus montrouzieri]|uniref:Uncharacterized protein n=1 Tax=Cryptolaemus montrouzieri TaxID=559131 RepID=A0ABD2PIB2_9CUCU
MVDMIDEKLRRELNILTESQLIELLITKNVENVKLKGEVLKKLFPNAVARPMDKNIDEFQESLDENQERNYGQIDALEGMIKVLHKLNDQLESRIEDQKEIITLLKIKNSEVNERQESKQNQSFSSDSTDNYGMNPPLTSQQCSNDNGQLEWTKAEKKKRNRRPNVPKSQGQPRPSTLKSMGTQIIKPKPALIRGTAENNGEFKGAERLGWLYVGRATPALALDKLENYLKELIPSEHFVVQELQKHESNTNTNKSYKVGFNFKLLEAINEPKIWPTDIVIKKFQFL